MESFIFLYTLMDKKLTIQDWAQEERPREKFLEKGAESLSDAELLAILIRSGNREDNAIELSRKILKTAENNLLNLKKLNFNDFRKFKGMGAGKILTIMAAFELSKRVQLAQAPFNAQIYSSKIAASLLIPILQDLKHEECWILYLNVANKLIAKEKFSSGGLDATVVDIKFIIKKAMDKLASKIILVHNHPTGSKKPGNMDKIITAKLKKATLLCDIELADHIIIAGRDYFSFADEGLL